uniref:Uncharacterized protein n=1 Tax=Panagrolaimus sp. PS1159 TaxID=55785 RepID=A0AC35FXT1_9BILA
MKQFFQSSPHSTQESPIPQNYNSSYLLQPCKISTDSRGILPQQPGPSTMPEQKFSPGEKAARSAAIAAIWKNGLPKNVTMNFLQTKFYQLKNQHILIFARHYFKTDEDPMKSNKDEYNQYYPNVMTRYFPKAASLRLRLVKIKNATQESNEMTVLGFDKDIEAGILELKNILEAETKHFFKDEPKPQPMQHLPIQKKLSQFDAKVEEIAFPPHYRIQSTTSGTIPSTTPITTEFQSHQRQFDIKPEPSSVASIPQRKHQQQNGGIKTYHSFTILPKNRLSNINIRQRRYKSQDEVNPEVISITPQTPQRTNFGIGNSPDVYIVDEKISVRCPSAEVANSYNNPIQHQQQQQQMLMHRTPAPDPWQPYPLPTSTQSVSTPYIPQRSSFIQQHHQQQQQQQQFPPQPPSSAGISNYPIPDPYAFDFPTSPNTDNNNQEWKIQSCEDLLNEIKSEAAMFEKEITSKPLPTSNTIISRNSSNNLDQNKPQQIRGTKRRESGRTFCNGAKAIVSYFSLDGTDANSVVAKQQRRTANSPFSELNASTIPALTAMP